MILLLLLIVGSGLWTWLTLAWAYAEAGGGMIRTADGALSAAEFQRRAEMPTVLRSGAE